MNTGYLLPRSVCLLVVAAVASGCASTTLIKSTPAGAQVFINGAEVGKTPYSMTDTNTIFSNTRIKLEHSGYEPFETVITRREEVDIFPAIGTLCLLVPGLWAMKYQPEHEFKLVPLAKNSSRKSVSPAVSSRMAK